MARPRRSRARRQVIGSGHIQQLQDGHDFFGDAFGNDLDAAEDGMLRAWADPEVRRQVYARHAEARERHGPEYPEKPWAEIEFGLPEAEGI